MDAAVLDEVAHLVEDTRHSPAEVVHYNLADQIGGGGLVKKVSSFSLMSFEALHGNLIFYRYKSLTFFCSFFNASMFGGA
mmetsp:Transcript_18155/g.52461  ORF Transcript_18155/g.52461 Transcript_18155/m.52461 type:complete len:80 (-) Transcript_18155:7-246(-)